jgi:hypothetical protein
MLIAVRTSNLVYCVLSLPSVAAIRMRASSCPAVRRVLVQDAFHLAEELLKAVVTARYRRP